MSDSKRDLNSETLLESSSLESSVVVNGQQIKFAGGTVSQLLSVLEVKTRAIAVELNAELVPSEQHSTTVISSGDRLEIVTLAGGG